MDKQDGAVRYYLAKRADQWGAIRLTNTAFEANAGTGATTGILFLRKHGRAHRLTVGRGGDSLQFIRATAKSW